MQEQYRPHPDRWRVLLVLVTALFMSLIGVSIVNVALPAIRIGLDASSSGLQWVLSGYALTFGVFLVPAGRMGDIFGRGPLFIIGIGLFTLSACAAGFAPDIVTLNIARALQGVGSGLLNPQALGMIQQYFRGAERGRAFGIFGGVVGVSVAIGPVVGGLLIGAGGDDIGWRWTFFVNVPFGLLAIVLAWIWIPKPLRVPREPGGKTNVDPVGAALLGLAVLAVMLPFMEAGVSGIVWLAAPVGLGLFVAWVFWEKSYLARGHNPMVDMSIFRVRSFSNGALMIGLYFLGVTSIWVLIALYMQEGLGLSALEAGLVGLPSALLSGFASYWAGKRVITLGRRVVIAGIYLALAGLGLSVLVVVLRSEGLASEWWLLATLSLIGIAQGLVISPNQALTLADVPLGYAGSSGGVMQTGQRIGTSVGIAMITAVAFAIEASYGWTAAFGAGFAAIALVVVAALVVAYRDYFDRRASSIPGAKI